MGGVHKGQGWGFALTPYPADVYAPQWRDRLTTGCTVRVFLKYSTMASPSGVREPTGEEFNGMASMADIMQWSRLTGTMSHFPSQQGSLIVALGADPGISIEEFAAVPADEYDNILSDIWYYSESVTAGDDRPTELTIQPSAIVKARARSAHHAARLWIGAEDTRAVKSRRLDAESDYRAKKLVAMQTTANTATQRNNLDGVQTVPINEIADTTQKWEVPVMPKEEYHKLYRNYKK